MKQIQFTPKEAEALMHRLGCFDCLEEVFADSDELEHLTPQVDARARQLSDEIQRTGGVTVDPASELDRELLIECLEGSTWVAVHDFPGASPQSVAAAERTLRRLADKIAPAFCCAPEDLSLPGA